jgi:hypothetical protein
MTGTVYSVADMLQQPEHGLPYTEKRDTFELYKIPYYEDIGGVAPCGAIISNIEDMSHWLIALMNGGRYEGRQVLAEDVLKATMEPAIALPNTTAETRDYWEVLNVAYGMGRKSASYRGHLLTYHGGDLPGFHSQVSFMPRERIGVIVFVIGNHCASLFDTVSYNVYERLLGLTQTPWSERLLDLRLKGKKAGTYEAPTGLKFQIVLKEDGFPYTIIPGEPEEQLVPYKGLTFRIKRFSDLALEFVVEKGEVKALKVRDPAGEYVYPRK